VNSAKISSRVMPDDVAMGDLLTKPVWRYYIGFRR
jgi:hypothetical protein